MGLLKVLRCLSGFYLMILVRLKVVSHFSFNDLISLESFTDSYPSQLGHNWSYQMEGLPCQGDRVSSGFLWGKKEKTGGKQHQLSSNVHVNY